MLPTEATPPTKPRITHLAQQRWLEDAHGFLQDGKSVEAIDAFLQNEGCPPRLRQELLRQATARHLGQHRGKGLRLLGLGLAVIAVGVAIGGWAMTTLEPSVSGELGYNRRLAFWGAAIAVVGVQMGLVGAWKTLTGSRVDVLAERS